MNDLLDAILVHTQFSQSFQIATIRQLVVKNYMYGQTMWLSSVYYNYMYTVKIDSHKIYWTLEITWNYRLYFEHNDTKMLVKWPFINGFLQFKVLQNVKTMS